jgi:hypothetical protein
MVLYLITKLNLPITKRIKDHYIHQFNIIKIASNDEITEKQDNTSILSFKNYLEKIKDKFGTDSKEYLLSSLYFEVTLRDDFILKIVSTIPKGDAPKGDKNENYVVVPKRENITVIINHYKTSDKYGTIKVKLSTILSKMIRNFITYKNLNPLGDDYLFGNKPLTQFVTKMNKTIGVQGGINNFRKMSVSDLLNNNPSPEERAKLAESMKHSPIVQTKYLRNIEK